MFNPVYKLSVTSEYEDKRRTSKIVALIVTTTTATDFDSKNNLKHLDILMDNNG